MTGGLVAHFADRVIDIVCAPLLGAGWCTVSGPDVSHTHVHKSVREGRAVHSGHTTSIYPATLVNFNQWPGASTTKHLLHFDDGMAERVGLPDDSIKIMTETVKECPCNKCAGAKLPLPALPWQAKP